jgi:hypothetical protein
VECPVIFIPITFISTGKLIGIYPLKQFAPVIHGNHRIQGRIAMGSPSPGGFVCRPGITNYFTERALPFSPCPVCFWNGLMPGKKPGLQSA